MSRRSSKIRRFSPLRSRCPTDRRSADLVRRRAVTLLELLIALTIVVMVAGALGAITRTVELGFEYNQGRGTATQHARVLLDRISRTAQEATANEQFPGFIVLAEQVGLWRFPDTLVIWHPDGDPAAPDGLPRLDELVIYCPHPEAPGTLVEITTSDTAALSQDEAVRKAQIDAIKRSNSSEVSGLTSLMRTGGVDDGGNAQLRGALRFETLLRPSDEQLKTEAEDLGVDWEDLPWVQGIYGSHTGLRQAWVRIELQLMTGDPPAPGAVDRRQAIPFFGSAALYYTIEDQNP
jgi:hypothetical protein